MDDEVKELLQQNLEISEKSLKILKKMHHAQVWRSIFSTLKWGIIIGLTVFGFIQFQPYLNTLLRAYQQVNQLLPK